MNNHVIFGVHVTERLKNAVQVQGLLSEYGCYIKTRLGLHEVSETACSPNGILILEMFGDEAKCLQLAEKLGGIEGIEVKKMIFGHQSKSAGGPLFT